MGDIRDAARQALENFLDESPNGEVLRNKAFQFLFNFRIDNILLYIQTLTSFIADQSSSERVLCLSAIFLTNALHKRSLELQRHFLNEWLRVDPSIRLQLLQACQSRFLTGSPYVTSLLAQLMGLVLANEITTITTRGPVMAEISGAIEELLNFARESPNPQVRIGALNVLSNFCAYALEIQPNCARDFPLVQHIPPFYLAFIICMNLSQYPEVQKAAIQAMTECLLVFRRPFSFPEQQDALMRSVMDCIAANNPIFFSAAYLLLRKIVDYFYVYLDKHINAIVDLTLLDLQSDDQNRQIEACFLWLTIGDVESDILAEDKSQVKARHRDIQISFGYSITAFNKFFDPLVRMICSIQADETQANIALDHTQSHAAFSCLSSLTKATDELALPHILPFIQTNSNAADWRLRYCSALLLNAASQLPSFNQNPDNILLAYRIFVNAVGDTTPRITEVAMWSLGRIVKAFPDIVADPELFTPLCEQIALKMNISQDLTSRACWLLNACFNTFSADDDTSILVVSFDQFSEMLLDAIDTTDDIKCGDAAFGALNRLIERTPSNLDEQYSKLFHSVTSKMGALISAKGETDATLFQHKMIGFCSIVQAIVMNVSDLIGDVADQLMKMLFYVLKQDDGILVCEVLPAMGAVARAVEDNFTQYVNDLLGQIFTYLSSVEFVHPAAIFVSDLFSALHTFPHEITQQFVQALFATFEFENLPNQARIASFSALCEIAKQIGVECQPWLDSLLELLESESRSTLVIDNDDDDGADTEYVKSFILVILQIYQTTVPILASLEKGDRKVRNFFHIFEKLSKLQNLDDSILPEVVILIQQIAQIFGRKMNVYLNKPTVIDLLNMASKSDDEAVAQLALETIQFVKAC